MEHERCHRRLATFGGVFKHPLEVCLLNDRGLHRTRAVYAIGRKGDGAFLFGGEPLRIATGLGGGKASSFFCGTVGFELGVEGLIERPVLLVLCLI